MEADLSDLTVIQTICITLMTQIERTLPQWLNVVTTKTQ